MHKRLVNGILLLALGACGPVVADESAAEPLCDPWAEVCEVSLHPSWEARSVLDLETARMTDEPTDEPAGTLGEGQIRAGVSRYLALQSELDEPLVCLIPERFTSLRDVPVDSSVCNCEALVGCWGSTALFGLVGTDGAEFQEFGLLLKTSGGDLYRARILTASSGTDQSALTFEYEGVM